MRDQHRGLSNSDARVSGFVPGRPAGAVAAAAGAAALAAPAAAIDFNLSNLAGGFEAAYEAYLRRELTFNGNSNGIFYLSSGGIGAFTSTGSDDASLAAAFARNPNLRLFVGVNYFDLNAPFYAAEFTLAHLNVSPEVRAHNITVSHFEAGQMTYVDNKALVKLQGDLARFVTEAAHRRANRAPTRSNAMRIQRLNSFASSSSSSPPRLREPSHRAGRGAGATNDFYRFNYNAGKRCSPSTTRRNRSPRSTRSRCTGRPSSTPPTSGSCPSARPPAA